MGAVQAPPVYTDPVFPAPTLQQEVVPAVASASVQPVAAVGVAVAEDRLSITPDRVLAPVGSEVVLRAGICAKEGFLLTDQKVEWLIAPRGCG